MPGAHVFPGGRFDKKDEIFGRVIAKDEQNVKRMESFFGNALSVSTQLATAIRETLEESGISILYTAKDRNRRHVNAATLLNMLNHPSAEEASSLIPVLDNIWPISWWVTPNTEVRRYNTLFFLANVEEEICSEALQNLDNGESIGRTWLYPDQALDLHEKSTIFLPPPTRSILERMAATSSLLHFLSFVDRPIWPIHPQFAHDDEGRNVLVLPGDPLHQEQQKSSLPFFTRYRFPR